MDNYPLSFSQNYLVTIEGNHFDFELDMLYKSLHGKKKLIAGHYQNNQIKAPNFIKSNCVIIRTEFNEPISNKLRMINKYSNLVWQNYKNIFCLISLDFEIVDFREYIEVLKEFSISDKLCFGYNFFGTEIFLKPENISHARELMENYNIEMTIKEIINAKQ